MKNIFKRKRSYLKLISLLFLAFYCLPMVAQEVTMSFSEFDSKYKNPLDRLRQDSIEWENKFGKLKADSISRMEKIKEYETLNKRLKNEIKSRSDLKTEIKELEASYGNLEKELKAMKGRLDDKNSQIFELEKSKTEQVEKNEILSQKLSKIERDLAASRKVRLRDSLSLINNKEELEKCRKGRAQDNIKLEKCSQIEAKSVEELITEIQSLIKLGNCSDSLKNAMAKINDWQKTLPDNQKIKTAKGQLERLQSDCKAIRYAIRLLEEPYNTAATEEGIRKLTKVKSENENLKSQFSRYRNLLMDYKNKYQRVFNGIDDMRYLNLEKHRNEEISSLRNETPKEYRYLQDKIDEKAGDIMSNDVIMPAINK